MTIFADQSQNLVLASPDGSNGQPSFRALTANDLPTINLPGVAASSITANSANVQSTDTYITAPFHIPANTIVAGTSYRIIIVGDQTTINGITTVRLGPHGNTSDSSIFTANSSSNLPQTYMQFILTVRDIGANANVVCAAVNGFAENFGSGVSSIFYFPTVASHFNTQIDNYLGASYVYSFVFNPGPNIFQIAVVEQIR